MNLEECRARINTIDDEMLKLFIDRMKMANEVAKYKAEHHLATLNPKRERDILLRISEQTGDELGGYARVLFSTLFDLSRSYQRRINAGPSPLAGEIAAAGKTPTIAAAHNHSPNNNFFFIPSKNILDRTCR